MAAFNPFFGLPAQSRDAFLAERERAQLGHAALYASMTPGGRERAPQVAAAIGDEHDGYRAGLQFTRRLPDGMIVDGELAA